MTKPDLPSSGGSYVRKPDGTLVPAGKAPVKRPSKGPKTPAEGTAK